MLRSPGCNSKQLRTLFTLYSAGTSRDTEQLPAFPPGPGSSLPLRHTLGAPGSPEQRSEALRGIILLEADAGHPALSSVLSPGPFQPGVAFHPSPLAPARRSCNTRPFIPPCCCHWRRDLCARPPHALPGLTCARATAAAAARCPDGPAWPGEPGPGLRAAGLQKQPRRHRHQHEAMVRV